MNGEAKPTEVDSFIILFALVTFAFTVLVLLDQNVSRFILLMQNIKSSSFGFDGMGK